MGISAFWVIVAGSATVLTIVVGVLKVRKYVDDRIQEVLSSDEVIRKISLLIKPDMIFDDKGSILIDRGASAFVKVGGIYFLFETFMKTPVPSEIRISFTKHLQAAPLLTPLDHDSFTVHPSRGEGHDWIFKLTCFGTDTLDDTPFNRTFRLEII